MLNVDKRTSRHHVNTHRLTERQLTAPADVAHLAEDVPDAQPALIQFEDGHLDAIVAAQPLSFAVRSDWSAVRAQ